MLRSAAWLSEFGVLNRRIAPRNQPAAAKAVLAERCASRGSIF